MKNRINLLYVIVQMGMGGSERLVHSLISGIDRSKFNPYLCYFYGNNIHPEFLKLHIPIFKIEKNKRLDIKSIIQIQKIVEENNIRIVHAQHFMPMIYAYYGCKIRRNVQLYCTFHSEWELSEIPMRWRLIGRIVMNNIDGVIGVTSKVSDRAQNIFTLRKAIMHTIHNGVDLKKFKKTGYSNSIRDKLGINKGDIVIGTTGNLKKVKNQLFLLRGFHALLKDYPKARLLIIGQSFKEDRDDTESKLRNYIYENKLLENVFLLGYREDIPLILNEIDIFCLTSNMEGLPISLIEAMSVGLPVVGTDIVGIKDVIVNNYNGLLIPNNNVECLKESLEKIINNKKLKDKISKSGQNIARELYSLENCIRHYEMLYLRK